MRSKKPDGLSQNETVSLGITVQSAPVVASDMPPWEKIFIYAMAASGAAILALGAFALNRYKAAKENAKTIDGYMIGFAKRSFETVD